MRLPTDDQSRLLYSDDEIAPAIELVRKCLAQDENNPYLWHLEAYLTLEQDPYDLESAIKSQERAVQLAMDQGQLKIDPFDLDLINGALDDYRTDSHQQQHQ